MSTTIDQRVVEMRFDNKQFESGVSTTMSTLDKLKQKLNLTDSAKGLDNLGKAANNINMSGLGTAVETVRMRFSALEVMGVTALANITNSAVNAGKRIVSALTIDPVKTGFNEYELKMNSVKTIMSSTGESIETVNSYLEELNKYSDQTIYSFSDMTQNIGKFTNAGVKLEDAVAAIKGISNEAAVSGANANEASRAMYNFAQALSAGYVKLIDWKSIENANMATVEFKQQLIDTALAMGTVTKSSDGMYVTLSGKTFNATKNFNEVLQEQWMTSEVLIETLKKYADENTDIGKKASEAATQVKTFTQLFDTLKESAQSGWAKTWEILIGNLDEATEFLTSISKGVGGFIDRMSEARNVLLESALGRGFTRLSEGVKTLLKPAAKAAETVKTVTSAVEDLDEIVNKVIRGEFGNGQARFDALTAAGINHYRVQNKVNEALGDGFRYTEEQILAQDKLLGITQETTSAQGEQEESIKALSEEEATRIARLAKMSDAQLKAIGYTDKQIEALRELQRVSDKLGIPIKTLLTNLDKINGRWLLLESIKNVGRGIAGVFEAMGEAWKNIFPSTTEEKAEKIFNFIAGLHKLSTYLLVSDEAAGKFRRTFEGVFALLDIVTTLLGGGFKIAWKILTQVLSYFDMDILDLTAKIGDVIVKFRDWLDSVLDISGVLDFLVPLVLKAVDATKEWFAELKNSEKLAKFVGVVKKVSASIRDWFESLKTSENLPADIIAGLVNGLRAGVNIVWAAALELGKAVLNSIKDFLGIHSPSTEMFAVAWDCILGLLNGFKEGASKVFNGAKELGSNVIAGITDFLNGIDFGALIATGISVALVMAISKIGKAVTLLASPLEGLGGILQHVEGIAKSLKWALRVKAISSCLRDLAISLGILAAAVIIVSYIPAGQLWNAVGVITALAVILGGLALVMNKLDTTAIEMTTKRVSIDGIKTSLLNIALGLLAIAVALKVAGSLTKDEFAQGVAALSGMLILIGAVLVGYGALAKGANTKNIDKVGKLAFKLAASVLLLTWAAKILGKMDPAELDQATDYLMSFAVIIGVLGFITKLAGTKPDRLGKAMLSMAGAMALLTVVAKVLGNMSASELDQAVLYLTAFVGLMALMSMITQLAGSDPDKVGKAILSLAGSLALMTIVAKILAGMSSSEMEQAALGLTAFVLIIGMMVMITNMIPENQVAKIGSTLIAMSVAIGIMALVASMLGLMDPEALEQGLVAVSILGVLMGILIVATQGASDCAGNLYAMAVAIAVMATALAVLSIIPFEKLMTASVSLGLVMLMFSYMISAGKSAQQALGPLIVMTVAIGVLAGALYLIAQLPIANALAASVSLSLLLLAMSTSLMLLSGVGSSAGAALKGVLLLLAMAVPLAAFAFILASMQNVQNATTNALALAALTAVLAVLLLPLTLVGMLAGQAIMGVLMLLAMAVPLLAFVGILALMQNVQNATNNALALAALATVLTMLLLPLSLVGVLAGPAILGVLLLTVMAVPLLAFVGILALMQNIQNAVENTNALINLMATLTAMLVSLAIVGSMAMTGVAALAALTGLILAIGVLAVGIGALMQEFPALQTFLDTGIPVLEQLARGLGSVISAFAEGLTASLPAFAENLSLFADKLGGFITGIKQVDGSVVTGVTNLTTAVTSLIKANLWDSLTGSSLSDLGSELSDFGDDMADFSGSLKSVDLGQMSSAITQIKRLGEISDDADFGGLEDFGEALEDISTDAVGNFISSFESAYDDADKAGKKLVNRIVDGLEDSASDLSDAAEDMSSDAALAARNSYTAFYQAGAYMVAGFASGISANTFAAEAQAAAMAKAAASAAEAELEINSPSKVFRRIGTSVPEGFAQGIGKLGGMIKASVAGMADVAVNGVQGTISRIADMVNMDIDAQPTIRPVLDLSDVRAGANSIGGMFKNGPSVGVLANVGVINSMMNRRIQNGANADVVSAIDKLNKKMDNFGNTSYNINGVTYDDGSNVSEAVRTLVRAAKIERRV